MVRVNTKGKIIKGAYAPLGEVLVAKDQDTFDPNIYYYYIYIWPNNGTKWPDSDDDMVYDYWLETWELVESFFQDWGWEVEWYDEDDPRNDVAKHLNPDSGA